jgi:hypothetical protein
MDRRLGGEYFSAGLKIGQLASRENKGIRPVEVLHLATDLAGFIDLEP